MLLLSARSRRLLLHPVGPLHPSLGPGSVHGDSERRQGHRRGRRSHREVRPWQEAWVARASAKGKVECVCGWVGGRGQARREGRSHCTHRSRRRLCQQRSRTPGCPSARPNTRPRGGRGFPRPSKRASPPTGTASRYTSRRPPSPRGRRPSGPRRGRRRWRRRRFSGAPRSWKGRSGSQGRAA